MVIKYRRPTSASRVGQDMRNTWSHVVGNLATLVLLALAGCLGYLFWPYLPTLAWAQLVAFSLRGLRDRLCADDGPAPRDPEVAPPFLAVLIGRHVDGVEVGIQPRGSVRSESWLNSTRLEAVAQAT